MVSILVVCDIDHNVYVCCHMLRHIKGYSKNINEHYMEDPEECAICLQTILPEQRCVTNCNHRYCESCIETMLNIGNADCPICRSSLKELYIRDEIHRIVKVKEPTEIHMQRIYINLKFRRLILFGVSVLSMGMFYFAYYVWDTHESNKDTKINLKVCEEMLRHSTNTELDNY